MNSGFQGDDGKVYSRIVLAIPGDVLGRLLELPEGLRVLGAEYKDRENMVELLVEGEGRDKFKYGWRPGFAVVMYLVNSKEDITERLLKEKDTEKIPEERGIC